jgi:hypothetical protein
MPKNTSKKPFSFWRKAISDTWAETEISSIIIQDIGGTIVTVLLLILLGVTQRNEMPELFGLAIVGGIVGVILWFIYRLLFITPDKIINEISKKTDLTKPSQVDINLQKKVNAPSVVVFLIWACAGLSVISTNEISKNIFLSGQASLIPGLANQVSQLQTQLKTTQKKALPQPLPMTAIPATEVTQPIAKQTVDQTTTIAFEPDFVPTNNGPMSALEMIQQGQAEGDLQKRLAAQTAERNYWINALPNYDQTVLTLYNILKARGDTNGESVATYPAPAEFLQCLPRTLSAEYIEKTLGEIRLSKNTNMDFKISVMNDTDSEQRRLKISCDSGYFIVHPWGGQFYWRIQTVDVKDTEMGVPFDEAKQKIFDGLNALIDGQAEYLNQTSK